MIPVQYITMSFLRWQNKISWFSKLHHVTGVALGIACMWEIFNGPNIPQDKIICNESNKN